MTIARVENSINPIHLVMPDRVIVPMPKPFDSPPGVVPFHRMLEAENLANRPQIHRPHDTFEPIRSTGSTESPSAAGLAPKLNEVLPVTPSANAPIKIEQMRQVQIPATGRVLDLYL